MMRKKIIKAMIDSLPIGKQKSIDDVTIHTDIQSPNFKGVKIFKKNSKKNGK